MKKISFLIFGVLTLFTLSFVSSGPPKDKSKKRKKHSFFRLQVEQEVYDVEDDSSNNTQN